MIVCVKYLFYSNTIPILATHFIVFITDYVTVTREHSKYNVSENRLSVVVCGVLNTSHIIDCAVNYEFEISLNLRDISAGRNSKDCVLEIMT